MDLIYVKQLNTRNNDKSNCVKYRWLNGATFIRFDGDKCVRKCCHNISHLPIDRYKTSYKTSGKFSLYEREREIEKRNKKLPTTSTDREMSNDVPTHQGIKCLQNKRVTHIQWHMFSKCKRINAQQDQHLTYFFFTFFSMF